MSEGQVRITSLEPDPAVPEGPFARPQGDYVPSVTSFRSNVADDHYVVSLSEDGRDESPMGYVDRRAAVDLACHFVAVANELGAKLVLRTEAQVLFDDDVAYGQGRNGLRDELKAHLNAV